MFSLAKGAFAVSGEAAIAVAVAVGATVVTKSIKLKYDDDKELKSAIKEFVENPSIITLHDLHYVVMTFKSSNYKPPVFTRPLVLGVFDQHPELLTELTKLSQERS
jgi:hypothetical protein